MALIARLSSIAASGNRTIDCGGQGPVRVYVTAVGGDLTSCDVSHGVDASHMALLDDSSFDSISSGVTKQILIPAPVYLLKFAPVGTNVTIAIAGS